MPGREKEADILVALESMTTEEREIAIAQKVSYAKAWAKKTGDTSLLPPKVEKAPTPSRQLSMEDKPKDEITLAIAGISAKTVSEDSLTLWHPSGQRVRFVAETDEERKLLASLAKAVSSVPEYQDKPAPKPWF